MGLPAAFAELLLERALDRIDSMALPDDDSDSDSGDSLRARYRSSMLAVLYIKYHVENIEKNNAWLNTQANIKTQSDAASQISVTDSPLINLFACVAALATSDLRLASGAGHQDWKHALTDVLWSSGP